jgi:DNA gyrase/topoisomerase IV subunit B
MNIEINVLTVFEAIRKRPEMYLIGVDHIIDGITKDAELQNGVRVIANKLANGFEVMAENYKYDVFRPYNPGKGDCYLINDLTMMYSGGLSGKNRCLVGGGVILNAISKRMSVGAWDGVKYYVVEYINNETETGCRVNDAGYSGLIIQVALRDEFLHFLGK